MESLEPSRVIAFGAGGARYDFLLCCSIMLIAHSRRFTGVRLAAWRKASLSCGVGHVRDSIQNENEKKIDIDIDIS